MTRPPVRLIDSADVSPAERALLEAGQHVAPVHYDVALGAAKFQASLQATATASATASTSTGVATTVAKTATLTKLAVLLVPTLGAVAAYYAMRSTPQSKPTRAPIAVEQPVEANTPPVDPPGKDLARAVVAPAAVTSDLPTAPREAFQPERTRNVRRTTRAVPERIATNTHAGSNITRATSAAVPTAEPATSIDTEPQQEPEALEEPTPAPKPAPAEAPDAINELRGIASARAVIERDPSAALAILQRLSRVHPNGYFVEERAALTVLALAGQGDADAARKHAAKFLKAYPTSPFADRVRAAIR